MFQQKVDMCVCIFLLMLWICLDEEEYIYGF